ncbi:E3 ubiquitin-protein ligase sspH1 [compost metagenome]
MARWAWWDNLEKMLSDILNAALLVAMPLVPGLGELMLAYTAYQLTSEVVEGIVDLAEGRLAEAVEQTINVLESVVQLGAFAAGVTLAKVVQAKLSPFFEGLKPVQISGGQTRLWNPDLTPYQRLEAALPTDAKPDASGVYQHQDQRIVRLDDQHFIVDNDPVTGQHRIQHPQRPDAYAPTLTHNGHGAWVAESENPRLWQGPTLMRRLGHTTDAFSNVQLEQVRQISGTEEAELRRVHMDNAPPPPLLVDTLQRLDLNAEHTIVEPNPDTALLFEDFPELPNTVAEKILAGASVSERQRIAEQQHLPMRLKTQARELQFETQSVRAAQGLYHEALTNIDTERLVLGALRIHTDTFGDLRIEIRNDTIDGELRCSAGFEDSSLRRILVRNESGKYSVRDNTGQRLHETDYLLESVLHALGADQRRTLGYKPGDGEMFKDWLIAKTAAPNERRTVLAQPPIRPIAQHENLLLLRGGALSREGKTLHERIQDLHPHFSEYEVDTFANALIEKGEPLRAIEQHENDLYELNNIIDFWRVQSVGLDADNPFPLTDGRKHIAERLIDCFQRKNRALGSRTDPDSYSLDLSVKEQPIDLEALWPRDPEMKKFFDKITVLKLDNTRFSTELTGLLKDFPILHELSAKGCELTRLPKQIGNLPRLERLRLSDNEIVLDASDVERLKQQTRLEILRLDENPLGRLLDIGLMPRLKVLTLRDTVIMTWPKGVFKKSRPRGFLLDMRDNHIGLIPEVVPGSLQAWIVARTRLDVGNLSETNQMLYQQVRHSVSLPPEPVVPANNRIDAVISSNYSTEQWSDVPGWGVDRANLWSELIDEPQAQQFMTVLLDTQGSADYLAGGEARDQLLQRIWRMLDAVQIDTPLREKLFTMAIAPVDFADAGAQLFNNMGINVLASEAYSYSTDATQLEQKLVTLAKGASRLEQVNEIARADVAGREGNPDDVEVYLAYQTGLAQRLGLPWQSENMLYRPVSGVTDAMIDQAYNTVLALEEGDGLVNKMLEQDFWEQYLKEKFPARIASNKRQYLSKYEQLESLRTTQLEWAGLSRLTQTERTELSDRLKVLMSHFGVPETAVFTDDAMSDATFDSLLIDLGYQEKQLYRSLTREALSKAGQ